MIPDNVEKIIMTKEDYDRNVEQLLLEKINAEKEIERLNKENNDLRKLYQRTYKHLFEIGNDELARYFQAQIDECPTFYVEPIIDYYEETKRLNNIIDELNYGIKELDDMFYETFRISQNGYYSISEWELKEFTDKLQELKGSVNNDD